MSTKSGIARLDDRGRVVLPAALRRGLGLRVGDEVVFFEEADGQVRMQSRRGAARALIGLAGPAPQPAVEQLRALRRREAEGESAAARRTVP